VTARFRPLVLCYHAVSDAWPHALALGSGTIERQLRDLLARGFKPASASDALHGGRRILHVTFDDAFRSVAPFVLVLERLGIPATVFACTRHAERGLPLDVPELSAEARRYPDELATMDWNELRSVADHGVEIGSHTVSHPHLPQLSDAELEREVTDSRDRLEAELGRPCRFLAYPFGDEDGRVRDAARRAGYDAAFALPGSSVRFDRYAVPRVGVYRRDSRVAAALKTTFVARAASPTARRLRHAVRARRTGRSG
jgi:peptidoglycan/xylan/chitin deacetylase (PgdA/CDA1 family)